MGRTAGANKKENKKVIAIMGDGMSVEIKEGGAREEMHKEWTLVME